MTAQSHISRSVQPQIGTFASSPAPKLPPTQEITAWAGHQVIAWDGTCCGILVRTAETFNPVAGTWQTHKSPLDGRTGAMGAWTGKELVVAGGSQGLAGRVFRNGAAYNPVTGTWRRLPPMPEPRSGGTAVWTGRQVLVWGGLSGHAGAWVIPPHGEAFNPATGRWSALPPAPLHGRMVAVAVWTGRRMIVWGGEIPGRGGATYLDGAAFTPSEP